MVEALDGEAKIWVYIRNVLSALEQLRASGFRNEVVEVAEAYVKDSMHYLSRGDHFNALATVAYAEGLLDALRLLGLAKFIWKMPSELSRRARTKVFVAGTFEILHPGHIAYLRAAWEMGRVVAVVARDETVARVKGREPVIPEGQRLEVLSSVYYVHRARLGYVGDIFRVVEEERPDVILLGPNQPFNEDEVARELVKRGLGNVEVMRFREYLGCPLCSTSRIITEIARRFSNRHY